VCEAESFLPPNDSRFSFSSQAEFRGNPNQRGLTR
jgi:hypothetical protein